MEWALIMVLGISLAINIKLYNKLRAAQKVISEVAEAAAGFVELSEMVSREIIELKGVEEK